ncbi:Baculoviral IAP repeat-containing protein 6 [Grifola frondosa]|uniref:Baculoviral IAP repeat-containing protein 6 n=1 Tax=Grifola frondosa TaxID=5627 RepID=A0A1C7MPK3_GRIFR|nr:Baculoviral IAP repeat-containing protein 6 [Grifola frondosa]
MTGRKRRLSASDAPESAKRVVTKVINLDEDEEESLESIIARIQAQEESEALARQLQEEWGGTAAPSTPDQSGSSTARDGFNGREVIEISDDEQMDDESLARKLAREWEALDNPSDLSASLATSSSSSSMGKAPAAREIDIPADRRLQMYRSLFIGEKKCQCGNLLESPRGHVVYSTEVPPPSLLFLLHAPCSNCKTNHCRGCFSVVPCHLSCKGKDKDGTCPVPTCCAEVRAIALFEALGGFDRQYIGERATSDSRARQAAAKARKTQVGTVGPGGTGYSTDLPYNRGRGRGRGAVETSRTSRSDALASHWDQIIVRALTTIMQFLPSPYDDSAHMYDMLPHASIEALLSLSQLPDLLGNLLRNDSVTDWIARSEVYHAMLALLRRMADCELTIEVLIGQRWEMSKSSGIEEWMWGDGEIVWETNRDSDKEGELIRAPPLYAHFKKLTKQCETFLAGASTMLETGQDQDTDEVTDTMVKATSLCGDIIAARDDIERAMTVMGKDASTVLHDPDVPHGDSKQTKGKGPDPDIALERKYIQECEHLAFQYVTLSQPRDNGIGLDYPSYNYAPQLQQTASATRNPKDRLHLIKELAVMATSLPAGVWVRVDEVRNDAIKIMIAGPEGTPYSGGLFEFDCFIPLEYPNRPPLMHLRTTGGGSVRFNPNLYNCGKVCLSLLGTWPGRPEEQWSSKSTLLQVLVSIQSMILVDLPYFNEPGFGMADPTNGASISYNRNIRKQTIRWAMIEWLKDEHQNGIWSDVIVSHFSIRNAKIRKCIQQWATEDPSVQKYNANGTSNFDGLASTLASLQTGGWAHSGSPLYTGYYQQPAATSRNTSDLLAKYDAGIQKIQQWTR